jgi:Leucine-rich repeat (LRR) protein
MSHHGARLSGLEPLPARPSTASIRIRTTPHNANPTPVASASGDTADDVADGFDFVRDEFTAERLRAISGEADLEDVRNLEIEVDTSLQSIAHLGELVPNLETLKLTNSRVDSFRDLGTRLRNLQIIWVTRCGITELDGIVALSALKELYIAFNDVSDLSPLALHEQCVVVRQQSANSCASCCSLETIVLSDKRGEGCHPPRLFMHAHFASLSERPYKRSERMTE